MARPRPRMPHSDIDPMLETLEWLMDRSIKVGPWSFGLDGLLGLIPGIGDATGGVISGVIVLGAIRAGLPKATIVRMVANVAIDSLLGAIPFVGDLFDLTYKANTKNIRIFRNTLTGERRPSADWGFLALILVVLVTVIALPLLVSFYLIQRFVF